MTTAITRHVQTWFEGLPAGFSDATSFRHQIRVMRDDLVLESKLLGLVDEAEANIAEAEALLTKLQEAAARAQGWQADDCGIFHPNRGPANGTGDPIEYADCSAAACEISGVMP